MKMDSHQWQAIANCCESKSIKQTRRRSTKHKPCLCIEMVPSHCLWNQRHAEGLNDAVHIKVYNRQVGRVH